MAEVVMEEGKEMPHEGIIKDNKVLDQHSYGVLIGFEEELRLLEKWLEEPKVYVKVAKEDESKIEFQNLRGEIGDRLQGNPLKEEENVQMVE